MNFGNKKTGRLLQTAKLFYTPVSFLFIFYFSWTNRILLAKMFEVADFWFLVISAFLWCALHLLSPIGTKIVFSSLGSPISYSKLLRIYIIRLPARYLPGGIWHTLGRLSDYHLFGIAKSHLTLLAIIQTFFPCLITFSIGGGYLWLTKEKSMLSSLEGGLALMSIMALLAIPLIVKWKLPGYWHKKFIFSYLLLTLTSIVFWLVASASFLFYYHSVAIGLKQTSMIHMAATYIFSWGVGYISIFAPQGIGVFEVVAGKLMALPMTLGGAVAFLAGFRIVALAADCLAWLAYRYFQFFVSKRYRAGQETVGPLPKQG